MIAILLGPPGCGKGTQAARLLDYLNVQHISTGNMLRAEIEQQTELGRQVAGLMEQGQLVPDDVMNQVVANRVQQTDCRDGVLLDGYPRTSDQATWFDQHVTSHGRKVDAVIQLVTDVEELQRRLEGRAAIEGRADDTPEAISERLRVYERQTAPLVEFYRNQAILHEIDGSGTPDEVFSRIATALAEWKA